jgi:hypothetical protein
LTFTAADDAGNTSQLTRTYNVRANQPDVSVKREPGGRRVGNNVYNTTGAGQTRIATVRAGGTATFTVTVENDGVSTDSFGVHGSDHNRNFAVRYYNGNTDVTPAVKQGSFRFADLPAHADRTLRVRVTARAGAPARSRIDVYVVARSLARSDARDIGLLQVRRQG